MTVDEGSLLPIFPKSFDDEWLPSRVTRYHHLRGNKSYYKSYRELFDSVPLSLTYWIPPNLDKLVVQLPGSPVENMREILYKNTLFPLLEMFTGVNFTCTLSSSQGFDFNTMPMRIVGEKSYTRICPDCVREDYETVGTPYLHRSHQVPGVLAS